jgi:hypothetical protein
LNNRRKERVMKTSVRTLLAVVIGIALVSFTISCASTGSQAKGAAAAPQTEGFLNGYYKYLQPGPEGGAKMRWLKPGVNFAQYNKIILEHVVFFFDDTSEYKGIDTQELDEVAKEADLALVKALKDKYPIVTEPAPDVLRIRFAITNLKATKPALGVITTATMILPVGAAISLVKKAATGSWTGSGATGAELMAIDSMSNEVIAVARDDHSAAFFDRYTKYGSVENAFEMWGERLVAFLEDAKGKKKD